MTTTVSPTPKTRRAAPPMARAVIALASLRAELEADGALGAELPAALLLDDVCRVLGLTTAQTTQVLGAAGADLVAAYAATRYGLAERTD